MSPSFLLAKPPPKASETGLNFSTLDPLGLFRRGGFALAALEGRSPTGRMLGDCIGSMHAIAPVAQRGPPKGQCQQVAAMFLFR